MTENTKTFLMVICIAVNIGLGVLQLKLGNHLFTALNLAVAWFILLTTIHWRDGQQLKVV